MRKVKDIMTKEVISVTPETKVKDIADAMLNAHLTGVPVVENEQVVGIITDEDLVASEGNIHVPTFIQILDGTLFLGNPDKMREEMEKITAKTAKELMSENVTTASPETDVHELATVMMDSGANPVPVVDGDGKLVGIVSRADIIHLIAHES
jgi:CBS domain-containing protein